MEELLTITNIKDATIIGIIITAFYKALQAGVIRIPLLQGASEKKKTPEDVSKQLERYHEENNRHHEQHKKDLNEFRQETNSHFDKINGSVGRHEVAIAVLQSKHDVK